MASIKAAILECAAQHEEFTSTDVIKGFGTNPANTTRRLKVMCEQGILTRRMVGRHYRYTKVSQ